MVIYSSDAEMRAAGVFKIGGGYYKNIYDPSTRTYPLVKISGEGVEVIGSSEGGSYTNIAGKPISRTEAEKIGRIDRPGTRGEALQKIGVTSGSTGAIPAGSLEAAKKAESPTERTFFLGTAQTGFRNRPQELTQESRVGVVQSFYPQQQQEVQRTQQLDTSILFQQPGPRPIQEAQARMTELYRPKEYALITGMPLVKTRYEYTTQRPYLSEYSVFGFPFGKQIPVEEGTTYIKPSIFGRLQKVKSPISTRLVSETDISRLQIGAAGVAMTTPFLPKAFVAVRTGKRVDIMAGLKAKWAAEERALSGAQISKQGLVTLQETKISPKLTSGYSGYATEPMSSYKFFQKMQTPETLKLSKAPGLFAYTPTAMQIQPQMQRQTYKPVFEQIQAYKPVQKPISIQTQKQIQSQQYVYPQQLAFSQPYKTALMPEFKIVSVQERVSITAQKPVFEIQSIQKQKPFLLTKQIEYPKYEGSQLFQFGKKKRKSKRKVRVFGEVSPIASIGQMFRKRGKK